MLSRLGALIVCSSLAAGAGGCAEISLQTVDTQTEVLSRHREVAASSNVKVRSRIDGTTLFLQTDQACELVEMENVRITEQREADEDLTEEFTVLGLATLPLVTGIIMLADAPNVYGDDRNSAQYNPTGPTGAYVGGTVLTGVGGLMALIPIIELLRVAAAGDETESVSERRGAVVREDVACDFETRPVATSVVLRVGSQNLTTRGTDQNGHLELDLAKAIPHEIARQAVTVQVIVAGRVVGELDIGPILDAQIEMQRVEEAESWQQVDRSRCFDGAPDDAAACSSVRSFLNRFPDGLHAAEAKAILNAHERTPTQVVAAEPESPEEPVMDGDEVDAIRADTEKARQAACRDACTKRCAKKATGKVCTELCVSEACQ